MILITSFDFFLKCMTKVPIRLTIRVIKTQCIFRLRANFLTYNKKINIYIYKNKI